MTSTAMQSDYVLPAAAWYERDEHKWVTPLMPFIHAGEKATSYYESKSDWEIISRLTAIVAVDSRGSRARHRPPSPIATGKDALPRRISTRRLSSGGEYGPDRRRQGLRGRCSSHATNLEASTGSS